MYILQKVSEVPITIKNKYGKGSNENLFIAQDSSLFADDERHWRNI